MFLICMFDGGHRWGEGGWEFGVDPRGRVVGRVSVGPIHAEGAQKRTNRL